MFESSPASRLRWAAGGLLTGMVACSGSAPETVAPDEPDRAEAIAAAEAQEAQAAATPDIAVTLAEPRRAQKGKRRRCFWFGTISVTCIVRSFHTEPLTRLSSDLAGYANGPVNLYVRWDQEAFSGAIRLRILPDMLVAPQLGGGGWCCCRRSRRSRRRSRPTAPMYRAGSTSESRASRFHWSPSRGRDTVCSRSLASRLPMEGCCLPVCGSTARAVWHAQARRRVPARCGQ